MKVLVGNTNLRVAIAGAGPAGSSLAIRLADRGFDVTIIERERFPRHKLCGEFISPECFSHFEDLGILDNILSAGAERISETRFYDRRGHGFSVPSRVFAGCGFALSLSRSALDARLLLRARQGGTNVYEGHRITNVHMDGDRIAFVKAVGEGGAQRCFEADIFVDATGRSRVLSKLAGRSGTGGPKRLKAKRPIALGFKNHLSDTSISPETCEIYSFPGGYGGLTTVEDGTANLCFLMDPRAARKVGTDPNVLLKKAVCLNRRAAETLDRARPTCEWLAVSVNEFGRAAAASARNLFNVGDSAAFIDPFTGSGILMALESATLLASAISDHPEMIENAKRDYDASHRETFSRRLRICSLLRRTAFVPVVPTLAIRSLEFSRRGRNYVARSTRQARTRDSGSNQSDRISLT